MKIRFIPNVLMVKTVYLMCLAKVLKPHTKIRTLLFIYFIIMLHYYSLHYEVSNTHYFMLCVAELTFIQYKKQITLRGQIHFYIYDTINRNFVDIWPTINKKIYFINIERYECVLLDRESSIFAPKIASIKIT